MLVNQYFHFVLFFDNFNHMKVLHLVMIPKKKNQFPSTKWQNTAKSVKVMKVVMTFFFKCWGYWYLARCYEFGLSIHLNDDNFQASNK